MAQLAVGQPRRGAPAPGRPFPRRRLSEAVRWLASFEQIGADDLPWAAPAHFLRGELLEQLGRPEEAAADYERVAELWRDCDRELRPILEEAQSRAARLRRLPRG